MTSVLSRRFGGATFALLAVALLFAWAGWWKATGLATLAALGFAAATWLLIGRPQTPPSITSDLAVARASVPVTPEPAAGPPSYADTPRSYGQHLTEPNPLPPWLIAQFEAGLYREHWDPTGSLCLASLRSLLAVVPPDGWDHPIRLHAPDMARHLGMPAPASVTTDEARAITGGQP